MPVWKGTIFGPGKVLLADDGIETLDLLRVSAHTIFLAVYPKEAFKAVLTTGCPLLKMLVNPGPAWDKPKSMNEFVDMVEDFEEEHGKRFETQAKKATEEPATSTYSVAFCCPRPRAPPRAGGDYDVALAPAIPPPAIHAPVGLAPAAYGIFDPDYLIIPPEEQAIGERLSIFVETTPLAPNDGYHRIQIDGVNHPHLNIVQNCHHSSDEMMFHVKIMLRQGLVLCIVAVYLIFKEGVGIYASRKSLNEVAETALKITLAVFAGLGAIYGVLAGRVRSISTPFTIWLLCEVSTGMELETFKYE
ncbi:hypothetical protein TWF217_005741 [Orbilia oligospora]|nr:hypothetical protein TWF217_005741 [Orbilia oligospora]